MSTDKILFAQQGCVAALTLNRPDHENVVDGEMMEAITAHLRSLGTPGRADILIIRGAGEHFCAGRHGGAAAPKTAADWSGVFAGIVAANRALADFPGISLALVQGKALGFGCGIAVQADITIAADNAHFGFPEIRAGFPPTLVMSYLSRWTHRKKAFEWVITGDEFGATEAERQGLVNSVCSRAELEATSSRWVEKLSKLNPSALAACKAFFRDTAYLAPDDAYRYGVAFLANFNASRSS